METTNEGTDEQDRLTRLPSANNTILLPFGQIIWSTYGQTRQRKSCYTVEPLYFTFTSLFLIRLMVVTCVRTFSHVRSCVFSAIISISVFEWPMLHTIQPFFILSICSLVTTDLFPVAVITISTDLTTCESFTTWKRRYNINTATKQIDNYTFILSFSDLKEKATNLP